MLTRLSWHRAIVSVVFLAAAVLILSIFPTRVSADSPPVRLPAYTVSATLQNPGSSSYFITTLTSVGSGYDVTSATPYRGWCIEDNGDFTSPVNATLYSSYDPSLPTNLTEYAPGKTVPWKQVNYILNHKNDYPNANWRHFQVAIWALTWGGYRGGDTPPNDQAIVDRIVSDAAANGANYIPEPGKIMAVILYTDGLGPDSVQDSIIEVTVPPPATLGGLVWDDQNGNGTRDAGEPSIPNVTVNLHKSGDGAVVATITTGADSGYRFFNLAQGSYQVQFVLPTGYVFTQQVTSGGPGVHSSADSSGMTPAVALTQGGSNLTIDAGLLQPTPRLSLTKTAVPTTYDQVGQVINYTFVVANTGNIRLTGPVMVSDDKTSVTCPAGDLDLGVSVTCVASYAVTQADIDNGAVTNHATAGARLVTSNPVATTVNAIRKPALSLTKTATPHFGNPVKMGNSISYQLVATNTGNVTLNGILISDPKLGALTCTQAQPAILAPAATLSCSGSHPLTPADLRAGKVDNTSTVASKMPDGTAGPTDAKTVLTPIPTATLGDFVWLDKNANGIQDAGEPGMSNVTVKLYDCATNALLSSTTTDASGHYRFANLAQGRYYVVFVLPSGYTLSPSDQGSNRAKDSDAQCAPKVGQKPDDKDGCDDRSKSSDDRSKSGDDRSKDCDERSKRSDDRSKSDDDRSNGCDDRSNDGDDGSKNDALCTGRTACVTLTSGQTNNDVDSGMVPSSGRSSDHNGHSDRKDDGGHKDSSNSSKSDCSDSKKS